MSTTYFPVEEKFRALTASKFFIELWEQLQARAKKSEDQSNLAGGMSYEQVKDRTSSAVGTEEDGDGGILFDETIAAYSARRKAAQEFLVGAVVESHQKAFKPYLQRAQWTTISADPTVDPFQLAITAELDEPLKVRTTIRSGNPHSF
jgi:hypothetical protein